ncbi:MAG: hypothetical protein EA427_02690 [Spirochaetaceae bacterium]|nr:MAG: hypothetical protein EA427_02690 [Spirochaetaceae bacterium]
MSASLLSRISASSLHRVVRDIILDELQGTRGRSFSPPLPVGDERVELGPSGLDLDSLERFSLAARLNEFFAMHETGLEDNLLRARTTDRLVDVIREGLHVSAGSVGFRTGGTTADPRTIRHGTGELEEEVRVLAALLHDVERVILTVPSHHIYGFLFGVLVPEFLQVPVVDARWSLLGGDSRPRTGDVIVSVPFLWEQLLPVIQRLPGGTGGVTSTAPLPEGLARRLAESPLERILEIYGSSETGGVGWRDDQAESFQLFPFWRRGESAPHLLERVGDTGTSTTRELPDRIRWIGDRRFLPLGRRDTVVQVGGNNIDLDELRRRILELEISPAVEDCALRLDAPGERLRACLVTDRAPTEEEQDRARHILRSTLGDAEIPGELTWVRELPRSALGKRVDWKIPSR